MATKLRLKGQTGQEEKVVDIAEARNWDYYDLQRLVVVEREMVRSYDELLSLAGSERFKDKDTLDVFFMITMTGGCH
ncbi:MAG: hypothetical protein HW414_1863 [Dehalococcoidia bacterium]|nr:hypothetical protein [Dehalococcoidia bacterium]